MADLPLLRRCELIVLRPDATRVELERLCAEARRHACQALCVGGSRVELAAEALAASEVKVAALVGFPFGIGDPDVKRFETEAALDAGAAEFHVVVNCGWLKDGNHRAVLRELRDLRAAAEEHPVTAIVELGLLTIEEARSAANIAVEAEIQFLATATGCAARATSVDDIHNLRDAIGPDLGLTAVGGITDRAAADLLIAAGANRLGVFALNPFREVKSDE